ncbi:MAG: hypothetical protein ORN98_02610, partial [Alphaproteobacteria bacterium]|nr:hypothetical protein [Alphaproteobacteria bacterium]
MTNLKTHVKVLKSIAEVRAEFFASGMTFANFARKNGFQVTNVQDVLKVKDPTRIRRGERFQIAVALG